MQSDELNNICSHYWTQMHVSLYVYLTMPKNVLPFTQKHKYGEKYMNRSRTIHKINNLLDKWPSALSK